MNSRTKTTEHCPACGAAIKATGTICNMCGKLLQEGYFPLDNLKASYRKNAWKSEEREEMKTLFAENKNGASEAAWAFTVYSLVPYIGILFCPGAVVMGGVGMFVSYRKPKLGGARTSAMSIAGGFLVTGIQIFLWWLLYYIPTLNRHF